MKYSFRHLSTGKAYPFMSRIGYLMAYAFLRKLYLHNQKGVPPEQPVLLAANHPTAFVDPCLLCTFLDPPLYNMTRGDIFRKPFFRKLMESINMFPVYRRRDGYESRERNDEVFEYCLHQLQHRRAVTIYVEGEHHLEKRVRPIQKGIARIAFSAYERYRQPDLQIIPVACNYVYGDRPRDIVMLTVGSPLWLRDYWEEYERQPSQAINRLCRDIYVALRAICYHVEKPEDEPLVEQLLWVFRGDHPDIAALPIVRHDKDRFLAEKAVCDRVNGLTEAEKTALRTQTEAYFQALDAAGVDDAALVNPQWGHPVRLLWFTIAFLPFLLGYITSFPIGWIARRVATAKVKKKEFYSSVILGVGTIAGMAYYPLWWIAALLTLHPGWIALALALPLLGWFALVYGEAWQRWKAARRALEHSSREVLLARRPSSRLS